MAHDDKAGKDKAADGSTDSSKAETPPHHEDESVVTQHSVMIGGQSINYTATAGRMILAEEEARNEPRSSTSRTPGMTLRT